MKLMKKILVLALTLTLALNALVLPSFAAVGDGEVKENYNAVIMPAKGGANAIATMTFDDGVQATNRALVGLLEEYGLKASLMLVPYRVEGNYGVSYSTKTELNGFLATGTVSLESHSYTHLYPDMKGYDPEVEVQGSLDYLKKNFPSEDVLTFAVPGGIYDAAGIANMMKTFYSARMNNSTASINNIQNLNPASGINVGDWYNLGNVWLNEARVDIINDYLGACVSGGGWFISGCHNIVGTTIGENLYDISIDNLRLILANMKKHQEKGDLWVATFSEATKYIRERQNSTVSEYATKDGLFVKVNMASSTEDGLSLGIDLFDMPLTVRVEIPEGWSTVRVRQLNGKEMTETYVDTFSASGKTFAYVDVLPTGVSAWLTDGNAELPKTEMDAGGVSIAQAKGGANGIVSMTFDDGRYDTAVLINGLFAEYGLKGSLMMTGTLGGKSVAEWENLFRDGRLEPQSHSIKHMNESTATDWTEDDWTQEIGGSKTFLQGTFPAYDCLTFAVPYSTYSERRLEMVGDYFYAVRSGLCPLSSASAAGKVQSLDPAVPGVGGNTYSTDGSWYDTYTVRMQPNVSESMKVTNSPEQIIAYLTNIARNGGWFISITHEVVYDEDKRANPTDGSEAADMTESQARQIFRAMQNLQDQGKIWVTTFSEATKYVRERQNATVTAYETADGMFVDLTMVETTADGLPLSPEIFNVPLTVKLKVPTTWGKLSYTQAGTTREVECFSEGGLRFAYIDLIPNGGSASIINTGDPTGYVETLGIKQNVSAEKSLSLNVYLPKDSLVTGVFVGRTEVTPAPFGTDTLVYSLGDVNVTDIYNEFNLVLKFNEKTGYSDYMMTLSVMSYFEALSDSGAVTAEERQLAFDFLVFARATMLKFAGESVPDVSRVDAVIAKLTALGCTPSVSTAQPSNLGTLPTVLSAADMAINEKPYYLFYVKKGFTGKLTVSYTDSTGLHTTEFDVVNGYYHCKDYVIFEVEGVYSLASELTITAVGTIGDTNVSASGNYSVKNYADGVNSEYVNGLYSWVLAASAYMN